MYSLGATWTATWGRRGRDDIRGVPNLGGVVFLFRRRVGRDARRGSHPTAGPAGGR